MADDAARRDAVDPRRSLVVQAPAGSGKTTLLVERCLALLAVVEAPEEILAITFTRKAAAEMRTRVLECLDPDWQPQEPHERALHARARAIADRVASWHLRENPERLLIRTIDSFNYHLARTMPVASALGPVPGPTENAKARYRQAARAVLALVDSEDRLRADVDRLLRWRDHRSQDVEDVLSALLGQRDAWLRALALPRRPERAHLEGALHALVTQRLARTAADVRECLDAVGIAPRELAALLRFAAHHGDASIALLADLDDLPEATPRALPQWQAVATVLLSQRGDLRRSIDRRLGFASKTAEKAQITAMLDRLRNDEAHANALAAALHDARGLPPPHYRDEEWDVLQSLIRVLERAAAELTVVFAKSGRTDYAGLAAAALRGLGDEETGYSDLGLYLDRRIRHVLVDEFQDTNFSQLHLLEKLTAGWEPGDGRSLFLVGDPMQSIYRFREAEVGLFLRARQYGVGALRLESRRLSRNFRSRHEIVAWVNERLGPLFPAQEDIASGAVEYAPSEAANARGGSVEVLAHPSDVAEADALARLVAAALSDHAAHRNFKAAILVRARSHLKEIVPALRRRGIPYRAVKLDPLTSRPVVQDLLALTRAIQDGADTTAWLAVLRSPVCGLTLAELHALAGDGRRLDEPDALDRLTGTARRRAERVFTALDAARVLVHRRPLRELVEGAWRALGGDACCVEPATALRDAQAFLDVLEEAAADGLLADWNDFLERLEGECTEGDPPSDAVRLEILTLHGAKGLEWDLVVLPALERRTGGNDGTLLHWLPFTTAQGDEEVLLAPLRAAEEARNSALIELIRSEQRVRSAHEDVRLLYVASTRARERLVLSAVLDPEKDAIKPEAGSLLAHLWRTSSGDFLAALARSREQRIATLGPASPFDQRLRSVDADWRPHLRARFAWQPALPIRERTGTVEYDWAGAEARRIGTALHRLLESVGSGGVEALTGSERARLLARVPVLLATLGTRREALDEGAAIVRGAFAATLDSETGRWVLSGRHAESGCEVTLAGVLDGAYVKAVVDRTFVDASGVRWIIDYKSGHHAGADLEGFLARERERYAEQLSRYRRLFAALDPRPIRTALYLPRHGRLEEVTP
jgi:ATP-dependent helicase/nuclease subunit A